MKKRIMYIVLGMICLFLCACSKEKVSQDKIESEDSVIGTPTITVKPSDETSQDSFDWMELESYLDEEMSRKNSNLLNYGYLTYDKEGHIYFINKNDDGIYVSDADGENRQRIGEINTAEAMLQKEGDWLYYFNNQERSIDKINTETGEVKKVLENGPYGQFVVEEGKIYTRNEGFCMVDVDGKNKQTLPDTTETGLCYYQRGNGFWLGNTISEYEKGYLVKYEGEKMVRLSQQGMLPLLAGHYLSVIDIETEMRHIWNLETKEDIDLNADTEKAIVSDGKVFYYAETKYNTGDEDTFAVAIYCWNGETSKEILYLADAPDVYHLFLTPEKLYYIINLFKKEKLEYQLWYYDLKTGETGQIY